MKRFLGLKVTAGGLFGVGLLVLVGCATASEADNAVSAVIGSSPTEGDAVAPTSPEVSGLRIHTDGGGGPDDRDDVPNSLARGALDTGTVTEVVDGDTVKVAGFGTIRIIGIDTPERGECGFAEAASVMRSLVLDRTVALVPGARDNRDRYGRLLRYVDVGDGDAGGQLISRGLAIARYDSRDGYGRHTREDIYIAADNNSPDRAQDFCAAAGPAPPEPESLAADCDPSYSGVCIPPYPPDLDCGQISERRFAVAGPDPHGFDGDHDGIGCES